jgi:hypothetical protein
MSVGILVLRSIGIAVDVGWYYICVEVGWFGVEVDRFCCQCRIGSRGRSVLVLMSVPRYEANYIYLWS